MTAKRPREKSQELFFFVFNSSQFEPKWLPLGRNLQRKGSSPNVSGMVITPESQNDFVVILVGHEWWARYQPQVGMGSTFWELSCSFSKFFLVDFPTSQPKMKPSVFLLATKRQRT